MIFQAASDGKENTLVFDSRLYGRSRCVPPDTFDLKAGIGIAILNTYLRLPRKITASLEGFSNYYVVEINPAYLLEVIALAARKTEFMACQELTRSWGPRLSYRIMSISHSYHAMVRDMEMVLEGQYDPTAQF